MLATRKLVTVFSILAAGMIAAPVYALRVTEPAAAAHGYPGLCDINGKKLADGEFRQWVENDRLHVVITYKFSAGEVYEEHSQFRQEPELIQEKWSWKESKHGRSQREFAVDFLTGIASAHISQDHKDVSKRIGFSPFPTLGPQVVTVTISHGGVQRMRMGGRSPKGDQFIIHPEIPLIAKFFVNVPDTKIWLANPAPAGFLRWEGPIVLPTDPIVRVDLLSGEKSGPAESAGS